VLQKISGRLSKISLSFLKGIKLTNLAAFSIDSSTSTSFTSKGGSHGLQNLG